MQSRFFKDDSHHCLLHCVSCQRGMAETESSTWRSCRRCRGLSCDHLIMLRMFYWKMRICVRELAWIDGWCQSTRLTQTQVLTSLTVDLGSLETSYGCAPGRMRRPRSQIYQVIRQFHCRRDVISQERPRIQGIYLREESCYRLRSKRKLPVYPKSSYLDLNEYNPQQGWHAKCIRSTGLGRCLPSLRKMFPISNIFSHLRVISIQIEKSYGSDEAPRFRQTSPRREGMRGGWRLSAQ